MEEKDKKNLMDIGETLNINSFKGKAEKNISEQDKTRTSVKSKCSKLDNVKLL